MTESKEIDWALICMIICIGILIVLCALTATGCNTIDGIGRDLQVAARSTAETDR